MSHWYDEPKLKKRLTKIQDTLGYRYEHKGESLLVFDSAGIVVRLTSWDKGMDFARVVESVVSVYERLLYDIPQQMPNVQTTFTV